MSVPVMVCVECRRVLDTVTRDGATHYAHTYQDLQDGVDHEPVPVEAPEGYRGGRCDFCSSDTPTYVLPARDFDTEFNAGSAADWAVCDGCAPLIERDQWNRLLDRVSEVREARGHPTGEAERTAMKRLWRTLRKNITGSLKPIPPLR